MNGPYAVALAAGMAATVNPCGFALLPAYLSAFVGLDHSSSRTGTIVRALTVAAALTAGFVSVFGAFGLIVTPLALRLEEQLPWVTIVIGVALVGFGVALLSGRQLFVRIPKPHRGGRDGTLPSMFLFGVSYAVASLSCTIAPFLAVTTSTFRTENWLSGLGVFVAYGIGMGVVIAVVTVAVALARSALLARVRSLMPAISRASGALLIAAGAYVSYYGWYEIRVLDGDTDDPIVDRAVDIQRWLQDTIVPDDPVTFVAVTLAVLAALVAAATVVRTLRHRAGDRNAPGTAPFEAADPDSANADVAVREGRVDELA